VSTPERWQTIEHIFYEALDLPPAERAAFLASRCNDDAELRREVESLLASDEKSVEDTLSIAAVAADWDRSADILNAEIDGYRVIRRLGSGGMGEVFLADEPALGRKVAIKFLASGYAKDPARLRRFSTEARALSALNHPGILTVHRIGEYAGNPYIASEYVDGETIRDRLRNGPVPPAAAIDIAVKAGEALAAAHATGIVHRDIKPENIMIRRDGYVKVLDFGLAKLADTDAAPRSQVRLTGTNVVVGTLDYMAPEQAAGGKVDFRSDIYSLAVVLYEMLTGMLPRELAGTKRSSGLSLLPKRAAGVLRQALSTDPAERQSSITEFVRELASLRDTIRRPTRFRAAIATITATAVLIIAMFGWRAMHSKSGEVSSRS